MLDYAACVSVGPGSSGEGKEFRFSGGFESLTEDNILWIRGGELTIPVDLRGARIYVLPDTDAEGIPADFDPGEESPEQIRPDRISALTGGVKVFAGGSLCLRDGRRIFVSTAARPLMVIFYEGQDRSLTVRTIRAGRHRNEFFNFITPYSFIAGAFSQIIMAVPLYSRPVYRLTLISALIALFTPLLPWLPPGIFLTIAYRRLWWRARVFRAYRDLVRLPRAYIGGEKQGRLPGGEPYIEKQYDVLPAAFYEQGIPFIIPAGEKRLGDQWHLFGVLAGEDGKNPEAFPGEPGDPFAVYGAFPGEIETLARRYNRKAYVMEVISWLLLLAGIGANVFFIIAILSLFRV
jgi:hypothetical protein